MASDKMLGSFDQKSAPEDNDLLVEYDASASKVKNVKFGGVWNWIVKKLTSSVINELHTSSKNVVGAINELNSKKAFINYFATNENLNNTDLKNGIYVYNGYSNYTGTKPFSEAWGIYFIGNWTTEIHHFCINAKTNVCYHRSCVSDKWSEWL